MPTTQTVSSVSAADQRISVLLGDIEAASLDTKLLAFTLMLEAARKGPTARETALVAQAMCSLSIRATSFSHRVRGSLPSDNAQELAQLRQMSRAVAELMHEAATLAAAELDGGGVDEEEGKLPAHTFEAIHARLRAIGHILDDSGVDLDAEAEGY
jgi:hypothetical protein